MVISILVENIKCGGCANSIQRGLEEDPRVNSVQVAVEQGLVEVDAEASARPELVARLAKLGYPEVDTVEGAARLKAKAKSFVSCAIGRVNK